MTRTNDEQNWALDREIVIARVFDAPRELVFDAWTKPEHLPRWFGPKGFTATTQEIDVRVGGQWRYVFLGPDGSRWDSRMLFLEVKRPELLVFEHGADRDDDPERFRTTVTFDQQSNGKTVVTLRQLHPTKELRDHKIGFGAVEYGFQTLDKLAAYLLEM